MEIIEILHFVPINVVNHGVIKWNENFFQIYLLNSTFNITLILSKYGDFAFVTLCGSFLDVDSNTELFLNALDLRPLLSNDESDKALVDPHLFNYGKSGMSGFGWRLARLKCHLHVLPLRMQKDICLNGGALQFITRTQDN
jgi:hypothetical protein